MGHSLRAAWIAVVLAGCGGTDDDPAAPRDGGVDGAVDAGDSSDAGWDAGPLTPERFVALRRELSCREAVRCEPRHGEYALLDQARYCHPASPPRTFEATAVAAGQMAFDREAAERCLAAMEESTWCDRWLDPASPCEGVFAPASPEGGACTVPRPEELPLECRAGTACIVGESCPGQCQAPLPEGAECFGLWDCEGYCSEGRCVASTRSGVGGPCSTWTDCEPSLHCFDGTCVDPLPDGSACDPAQSLCRRYWSVCADRDGAHQCISYSDAREGEPCQRFRGVDSCPPPMVCTGHSLDGVCLIGSPLGGRCDEAAPCAPGGRCVGGTCVDVVFPGDACDGEALCPLSHWCEAGRCVARPVAGQPCTPDGRCISGRCLDGVCTLLPDGVECDGELRVPLGECLHHCDGETVGWCRPYLDAGEECRGARSPCGPELACRPGMDGVPRCYPDCRDETP